MVDIGSQAQKWALSIVGIFVMATLAIVLLPLIVTQFASNGPLDNATGNSYTTVVAAVPTILIIVFIIVLILGVIGMLKMGKHR